MRSLAIDENYDIFLDTQRNLAMAVDKEAVEQDSRMAAYMLLGEYPFDTTRGVDYMGTLFQKKNPYLFESSLRSEVMQTPNVTNITAIRMLQTDDVLQYEITLETTFGQVTV